MFCWHSRKDNTCELSGICTLVHVNKDFLDEGNSISVYQVRYAIFIVRKYLGTATVKTSKFVYMTTFLSDMILSKYDTSTSDEQVDNLNSILNIPYRACIG